MGADGGSIPTRRELVVVKKRDKVLERDVELALRWTNCALSSLSLREPIVACALGRMYNKEAILQLLLDRASFGEQGKVASHIRGLRDVTELKLTRLGGGSATTTTTTTTTAADTKANEPSASSSNPFAATPTATLAADGAVGADGRPIYYCPITHREMTGRYKFIFFRGCGCVISEQALREVSSDVCMVCSSPIGEFDTVTINPSAEEEEKLRANMLLRKNAGKAGLSSTNGTTAANGNGGASATANPVVRGEKRTADEDAVSTHNKSGRQSGVADVHGAPSAVTAAASSGGANPAARKPVGAALTAAGGAAAAAPAAKPATYGGMFSSLSSTTKAQPARSGSGVATTLLRR
ncbi:hypothetical protein CAOG_00743 [Capsaspora owczarzaki ATCC 30864]|uniref:Uncharacterized protein n=1 Tax=Capsaspora owczarzaki (strain ATCC 30864) TaxID=595528 RepID=A0A0D2WHT0_CAPO3|nr:hypothetical protein CAOG_00743 [Capsaspora owczarzaki ATCC 30864]KJE89230.1 hypothetical protein CAOG_000743 [Capsaspora owczarzaki ATCC 30864]|eukprot:XP_004365614.1 hypothetical protein CAOG_00743 [Capsaspora owczarzaki ATCC 30864]